MVASDVHAHCEIKSMRTEALHARIQVQLLAAICLGMLHKPREHLLAKTFGPFRLIGYQVIDIHAFTPPQVFQQPKASHAFNRAVVLQKYQVITPLRLSLNAFEEISLYEARAQLRDDRIAAQNLFATLGDDHAHSACSNNSNSRRTPC